MMFEIAVLPLDRFAALRTGHLELGILVSALENFGSCKGKRGKNHGLSTKQCDPFVEKWLAVP